ncbi:MAG TPA: S16 family serine protease, partial [Anaerolineales bacterium]|nr:S16 family serine protease [Anaerolineales bacterium]
DVMKESARAALTYAKTHHDRLGIPEESLKDVELHVHVPAGAIPKDGPSAGVTMATAIVSALTGRPVFKYVGMTGEITLRGRVLPIGGVREKVLAAHRAGLKTVILPEKNMKDLTELPKAAKADLKIIPVEHMDQVLQIALAAQAVMEPPRPKRPPKEEGQEEDE